MYITIKNNLQSVYSLKRELGKEDVNLYFNEKAIKCLYYVKSLSSQVKNY